MGLSGDDIPLSVAVNRSPADRRFRLAARASGASTLVVMGLVAVFLAKGAWPALRIAGARFFTRTEWNPDAANGSFGIAAIVWWTVMIALIALLLAVPLAVASALFINEYAPRRLRRALTALVDLLAAIPSLIYGLWGRAFAGDALAGVARWLSRNAGFVPMFDVRGDAYDSSTFVAGVIVALMVLPIATSVMREVFAQTPVAEKEGALALGATRWGMVRAVVLPFGRGGIIGGSMLALGRALGETIAIALIISPKYVVDARVLERGSNSVGALIALKFGEAGSTGLSALLALGLALFAITLVVNFAASFVVARSRSGAGVEA
ncbi:MAG: phosphate ABC transporter permease subunit PstC [Actinobacteria bacterium]|nr:phosphate ABC transporter permease subunit PstC [Actinomycetota bacterium]